MSKLLIKMSSRILAQAVRITNIIPLLKSRSFDLACVLGYQCVVPKNTFHINDLVIYIAPESILPSNENTSHLADENGVIRIKACRVCNVLSEGYIAPLSWLPNEDITEGQILSKLLNITQWISTEEEVDKKLPKNLEEKGVIGTLFPKTDEIQVKQAPYLLKQFTNRDVVITTKMDGCSVSYAFFDNSHHIFSRNLDITLKNDKSNEHYHNIFNTLQIKEKLQLLNREIVIQGEICGPKINNGRTKVKELTFFVFNIYDITCKSYLPWDEVLNITKEMNLQCVPTLYKGKGLPEGYTEKKEIIEFANKQLYESGAKAEGIVIKTDDKGSRVSLKVISEKYMLKIEKSFHHL